MTDFSPKLKAAIKDIEKVMRKHDIGGSVILADGEGMAEYRLFLYEPSWSMLRQVEKGLHFKGHMASRPVETAKTVNMLYNIVNASGHVYLMLDQIKKMMADHMKVEEIGGDKVIPHEEESLGNPGKQIPFKKVVREHNLTVAKNEVDIPPKG